MAFKMKGGSMHKGTKGHKDALSSFKAANPSSMKNLGIFKTNPDGTRTRISADEFEQQATTDAADDVITGVNLGGRRVNDELDNAVQQRYILTGDDITKTPESALESGFGGYSGATAPQLVQRTQDYKAGTYQVDKDTDLSKLSAKDRQKLRKDDQFLYADAGNRNRMLDSEGVDQADLSEFLATANIPGVKGIGDLTDGLRYDRALQAFFNAGKPRRSAITGRKTGES